MYKLSIKLLHDSGKKLERTEVTSILSAIPSEIQCITFAQEYFQNNEWAALLIGDIVSGAAALSTKELILTTGEHRQVYNIIYHDETIHTRPLPKDVRFPSSKAVIELTKIFPSKLPVVLPVSSPFTLNELQDAKYAEIADINLRHKVKSIKAFNLDPYVAEYGKQYKAHKVFKKIEKLGGYSVLLEDTTGEYKELVAAYEHFWIEGNM